MALDRRRVSEVSVAVTAYITSLSQGMPILMNPKRPIGPGAVKQLSVKADQADVKRGASLYAVAVPNVIKRTDKATKTIRQFGATGLITMALVCPRWTISRLG